MGKKQLIIIESDYLAASVSALGVRARETPNHDWEQALFDRRTILTQLGRALMTNAGQSEAKFMTTIMSTPASMTTAASNPSFTVLEALGTIIADEDDIDPMSLANFGFVKVYADQQLDAPTPIVVASGLHPTWHLARIGRPSGPSQDGNGVLVGMLDTGIDATHPEFAGRTIHFAEFNALGQKLGSARRDAGDHGTHVAGLIAGVNRGVAPGASLAVAAVLTTPGPNGLSGSLIQISVGLNWLLTEQFRPGQRGVDVINASLGTPGYNPFLATALRNAFSAPHGVLMIASIGNDGSGPHLCGSPGIYPVVVGVGATDDTDTVAGFSDWGRTTVPPNRPFDKPDLCAPGVAVNSSVPGNHYAYFSGTSMASPIVAGIAAIEIERDPTLRGNAAKLMQRLHAKATAPAALGVNQNFGGRGRVQS